MFAGRFNRFEFGALTFGQRRSTRRSRGGRTIEAKITKAAAVALGALIVLLATWQPWYTARAVDGSAVMWGWGAWSTTGDVDSRLRFLPLALLAYSATGFAIFAVIRERWGAAVVGATLTIFSGLLPFMVTPFAVDRGAGGGGPLGIEVAAAPYLVVLVGVAATIVCWIGYARSVLRPSPRAEVDGTAT